MRIFHGNIFLVEGLHIDISALFAIFMHLTATRAHGRELPNFVNMTVYYSNRNETNNER